MKQVLRKIKSVTLFSSVAMFAIMTIATIMLCFSSSYLDATDKVNN